MVYIHGVVNNMTPTENDTFYSTQKKNKNNFFLSLYS